MKSRRQIVIASLIFLIGGLVSSLLIGFPLRSDQQEEAITPPIVQIVRAGMQSKRLHVRSQGRVAAHTEIDLVTEVTGRIIGLSPAFAGGGFFRQGDVLATIDPADYDLQVAQHRRRSRKRITCSHAKRRKRHRRAMNGNIWARATPVRSISVSRNWPKCAQNWPLQKKHWNTPGG